MPITDENLKTIRAYRIPALKLPIDFIVPNYAGRSIVNVPASIAKIFGVNMSTPPLDAAHIEKYSANVKRIVLVIVDALGYRRCLDALDANANNGFNALFKLGAQVAPLTSVFPSTTTAALTALWSGYTPAEHGFLGYQLFLREFGIRSQMISFDPAAMENLTRNQLVTAGLEPEKFLPVPSLPQTLARAGVPVYNLIEQPYVKSPLSRAQIRGTKEMRGFVTSSDMWIGLRTLIEEKANERALFVAYWSAIDTISHTYGPGSDAVIAEMNNLGYSFEREFLSRLTPHAREGTLFLLTADHGQMGMQPAHTIYMKDHPGLREHLVMEYTGEPRAAYLYVRNGEMDAVREYIATQLSGKFFVLDSQVALDAGLFGSGNIALEAKYRIGDLIALPREDWIIYDGKDEPKSLGRHGGLSESEMLVPLIASRLDG